MNNWNQKFIQFCFEKKILQFGKFKLKSGKESSFFFNFSLFNTGFDLEKLGFFYAKTIVQNNINYNLLFGIAYKGIPIAISTTIALKKYFNINVKYCFNRKEIKNHGEKGMFVGNYLTKNILILDDVITSGSSIQNTIKIIESYDNGKNLISNIVVALDRRMHKNIDLTKIEHKYNFKITSIINIKDIINYIKNNRHLYHYLEYIEQTSCTKND
ncbi:MAG: orotate phosphoribosyltransferase [Buchnera aphidicola (Meitanaphis flavogallis)]